MLGLGVLNHAGAVNEYIMHLKRDQASLSVEKDFNLAYILGVIHIFFLSHHIRSDLQVEICHFGIYVWQLDVFHSKTRL